VPHSPAGTVLCCKVRDDLASSRHQAGRPDGVHDGMGELGRDDAQGRPHQPASLQAAHSGVQGAILPSLLQSHTCLNCTHV
jgi:hypothetical protein